MDADTRHLVSDLGMPSRDGYYKYPTNGDDVELIV